MSDPRAIRTERVRVHDLQVGDVVIVGPSNTEAGGPKLSRALPVLTLEKVVDQGLPAVRVTLADGFPPLTLTKWELVLIAADEDEPSDEVGPMNLPWRAGQANH